MLRYSQQTERSRQPAGAGRGPTRCAPQRYGLHLRLSPPARHPLRTPAAPGALCAALTARTPLC